MMVATRRAILPRRSAARPGREGNAPMRRAARSMLRYWRVAHPTSVPPCKEAAVADRLAHPHPQSGEPSQAILAGALSDDARERAGRACARRPRQERHQQCGAFPAVLHDRAGDRRGACELQPLSCQVPRSASRQARRHGDRCSGRRRRVPARARAGRAGGRLPCRHHQFEPPRPVSGCRRRQAVLQAGDRPRHPGLRPSGRFHHAGDGRLSARLQRQPSRRQLSRSRA